MQEYVYKFNLRSCRVEGLVAAQNCAFISSTSTQKVVRASFFEKALFGANVVSLDDVFWLRPDFQILWNFGPGVKGVCSRHASIVVTGQ